MQADRYNQGKPMYSLIDYKSLEPMVRVLEYGCKKYSRDNWRRGLPVTESIDSMLRHIYALLQGERIDPESREQHIGHIMCNAMFISYALNQLKEFDNLPNEKNKDNSLPNQDVGASTTGISCGPQKTGFMGC